MGVTKPSIVREEASEDCDGCNNCRCCERVANAFIIHQASLELNVGGKTTKCSDGMSDVIDDLVDELSWCYKVSGVVHAYFPRVRNVGEGAR